MNFAVKYFTRKVCPVLMVRPSIKAVVSKAGGSVTCYTQCRTGSSYHSKFDAVITETASHCSPVVIILGWNGSKVKHLKKYSKIFEEKDLCTICVPAKPFNTFLRAGTKVKQISLHILDVLSDLNGQERPVFLYAFSNGGCAMFFHMMEAVSYSTRPSYQRVPIVGTIFDSCPIRPDFNSLKATKESVVDMIRSPVLKSILWHSMGIIIPAVLVFNSTVKRYMSGLTESPLQCPQLLLYSKADKLAPYQDIENYSQARKERGIFVVSKCWERSKHVNHYREHTAEYLDVVNYFIEHCLTTYESTKSDLVEKPSLKNDA